MKYRQQQLPLYADLIIECMCFFQMPLFVKNKKKNSSAILLNMSMSIHVRELSCIPSWVQGRLVLSCLLHVECGAPAARTMLQRWIRLTILELTSHCVWSTLSTSADYWTSA